jgi:hypothetical protein
MASNRFSNYDAVNIFVKIKTSWPKASSVVFTGLAQQHDQNPVL